VRISVIIPAHNAAWIVADCLQAVFQSTFRDFEVIVVNDCSTDQTAEIARGFPCTVLATSFKSGAGAARNLGAASASAEILVFVDSDVLIKPDSLAAVAAAFESEPALAGLFGSYEAATAPGNFTSVFKNLQHHYTHQTSNERANTFWSGFGAVRRTPFEEVGGFPSGRKMEDVELGYRLTLNGHRIRLRKDLRVLHCKRYTLAKLIQSDLFDRAVPWVCLMLELRIFRNDLNTRDHNVMSVPLSVLLLAWPLLDWLTASANLYVWALLPILVIGFLVLNRGFLNFVRREKGLPFAAGASVLCWLGYLYSGVGVAIGLLMYWKHRGGIPEASPARLQSAVSLNERPQPAQDAQ
jgi:glycosyltransferase involved in cell wall biosynthesis